MQSSQSWIIIAVICATFMHICRAIDSSSKDDKIVNLPGQPQVSFQQYAGYITIDEKQHRALFYYFVEAESDPASKPLVPWLNGGPGCSSIGAGAFSEHGPFRPRGAKNLVRNDYSWNKEANMLYLESPAGVGFSYSANKSFYDSVNDTTTAQDNLIFLKRWFVKFPAYKNRDFYITGESYAGHYVPQLAQLIVKSGLKFNLKGIAIGNPLLELNTDFNSRSEYYWSHGLISDATYKLVSSVCSISQLWRERLTGSISGACLGVSKLLSTEIPNSLDEYDVTADSCASSGQSQLDILKHPLRPRFQFSASIQSLQETVNQPKGPGTIDICVQEKTLSYLNRKDVQEALHSKLVGVTNWTICSSYITLVRHTASGNGFRFAVFVLFATLIIQLKVQQSPLYQLIDRFKICVLKYEMQNLEIPTIDVVGSLVSLGIRVLVYSGDQDSVIPFTGSRILIDWLAKELELNATVPYRPWFKGKQVGGWTQVYGDILSFATIRGAGHLAPTLSPKRSLALFTAFLAGKPLAETVP